jgi:hypothetical protein
MQHVHPVFADLLRPFTPPAPEQPDAADASELTDTADRLDAELAAYSEGAP